MNYTIRDILLETEYQEVVKLLQNQGLTFETQVSYTMGLFDNDRLIGTGSIDQHVIKMLAIDNDYQGENLLSTILTHLISILNRKNIHKYFIFTQPKNKRIFNDYNLFTIYENKDIILFENKVDTIVERLHEIAMDYPKKEGSRRAALVMNLNPMTNGHLYLIETCAKENDQVFIFVVEENSSIFPFDVRWSILKKATKHLKNVVLLPSTKYIISKATFPTYFIKKVDDQTSLYTTLDVSIFSTYFMDIFQIDLRYVGTEPYDVLTNLYNETLKSILGNKLKIIDRLSLDQNAISASLVRKLANEQKFEEIKKLVPKATYKYLKSKKGRQLIENT